MKRYFGSLPFYRQALMIGMLTVMERGEHWFYTEKQMRFLDDWIRSCEGGDLCSHCQSNRTMSGI